MKRTLAILLSCTLLLGALAGCSAGAAPAAADPSLNTVSVRGAGEIETAPDMATLSVGVSAQGATSQEARTKNTEAITATTEALKALGILEEDIQTSNMSLYPQYDYSGNSNRIIGYEMSTSLTITVWDLAKAGEAIDAAIDSGSNTLERVSFSVSNEEELYRQALAVAMEDAKRSADALSVAGGKSTGSVVSIAEYSIGSGIRSAANPDTGGGNEYGRSAAMAENAKQTALSPGTTTISAQVEVVYALAPAATK